jgi:hypothetical protein
MSPTTAIAHKAFIAAAQSPQADTFTFVDVVSEDLIKEYARPPLNSPYIHEHLPCIRKRRAGEKVGTVKLYRSFDEPLALEGEVTEQAVVSLVTGHGFPYFVRPPVPLSPHLPWI